LLYPEGELSFEQVESAVLNVARYDVFKLSESVLSGQTLRVQRMLDGLQAEGEAEVLVHYTLAEDIRALSRCKAAMSQGRPLPMALREQRIWGVRERLFERVLPRLSAAQLEALLQSAHTVDGIVKGLKAPGWPLQGWAALHRLAQARAKQEQAHDQGALPGPERVTVNVLRDQSEVAQVKDKMKHRHPDHGQAAQRIDTVKTVYFHGQSVN
ncbi:MAG: hypothetical protein RLZZ371_1538, partial [Pseudomonadota bacterium]